MKEYIQICLELETAKMILDGDNMTEQVSASTLKNALEFAVKYKSIDALNKEITLVTMRLSNWMDLHYFNWDFIEKEILTNWEGMQKDEDDVISSCFIGNHLHIVPSGKYYVAGLTSNQTWEDVTKDSCFWVAVSHCLEQKNKYWIEHGEGSPTDVFISRYLTTEEVNEMIEDGNININDLRERF